MSDEQEYVPFYEETLGDGVDLSDEAKETMRNYYGSEITLVLTGGETAAILTLIRRVAGFPWVDANAFEDFSELHAQIQCQMRGQIENIPGLDNLVEEGKQLTLGLTDANIAAFFDEAEENDADPE